MIAMIVMDAKNVNQSKLYIMSIPRRTLEECINLFNHLDYNKYQAIKQMENISEWSTAAIYWKAKN